MEAASLVVEVDSMSLEEVDIVVVAIVLVVVATAVEVDTGYLAVVEMVVDLVDIASLILSTCRT